MLMVKKFLLKDSFGAHFKMKAKSTYLFTFFIAVALTAITVYFLLKEDQAQPLPSSEHAICDQMLLHPFNVFI